VPIAFVVGLDWGGARHAVCVVKKATGAVTDRFEVGHDAGGLRALLRRLVRFGGAPELAVAIERPRTSSSMPWSRPGTSVVPIHPNVVGAARPRYRSSGAKDDRGDAYLLADLLASCGHRFRPLAPASDRVRSERYPTPQSAARLCVKRLAAFLATHAYCGRRSAEALLARLRDAPTGLAGEAEAEARGEIVRALVAVLRTLVAQIAELSARIRHAVAELPDGRLVMSFPRTDQICAATIVAEIGEDRARYPSADHLAADAGLCPSPL
jgi:hypothetical protein